MWNTYGLENMEKRVYFFWKLMNHRIFRLLVAKREKLGVDVVFGFKWEIQVNPYHGWWRCELHSFFSCCNCHYHLTTGILQLLPDCFFQRTRKKWYFFICSRTTVIFSNFAIWVWLMHTYGFSRNYPLEAKSWIHCEQTGGGGGGGGGGVSVIDFLLQKLHPLLDDFLKFTKLRRVTVDPKKFHCLPTKMLESDFLTETERYQAFRSFVI